MKILKDKNTKSEEQKLKEDTEAMRRHYGMLIDHHIIDFDMFENKVGKENVPEILQEYNKILMKCELAEYEADFIGICRHDKVDCALQVLCPLGFKCNHEHEHSNAKMCYLNKQGGELETFLLKNNTSVPKLLEMEKTIAETQKGTSKVPPTTTYGECTHPNRKCQFRNNGKCTGKGFLIDLCANLSEKELNERQEISKAIGEAIRDMGKKENNKCTTTKDFITELTIDKPSECTEDISFRPTPRQDERVNHPKHYQHPSGVECITVARHHDFNIGNALKYIWRAGLKQEQGLSPTDKQIEDLQKAVFYIQDEIQFLKSKQQEQ